MNVKNCISFAVFLLFYVFVFSQAPTGTEIKVEVSKEKTTINGKTFYLHTVKEGENIYRISLAYGVKQKDIILANPDAISGNIKAGQVLKIPSEPAGIKSIQNIESDNFIYHITEEQQTIFFLTQKYNVSKEELFKYNPELEFSNLEVGQVVRIPKKLNVSDVAETFRPIENYVDHKVRRKETKYSISREYNITVDELIAANPILNTEDLKAGSVIKIPVKSEMQISTAALLSKRDSVLVSKMDSVIAVPCDSTYKKFSEQFKIALLLPFSIEDLETRATLDSLAAAKSHEKTVSTELLPRTVFSLEFYQGFLIAVDSLKRAGFSAKIHTFDTGRDLDKLSKILSNPEMLKMDLIIGPFFTEGVEKVNHFSYTNKIKFVSPIVFLDTVCHNPYAFQILPGDKNALSFILNFIQSVPNKNIILALNPNVVEKPVNDCYKRVLNEKLPKAYKVFENPLKLEKLTDLMKDSVENIIIVPSSDETYIIQLFSRISLDSKKYNIKVFGDPACSGLRNVDQDYFHNIQFHFYTPFYANYQLYMVKKFVHGYRRKYDFEPQEFLKEGINFAFLGYDVGTYFMNALGKRGKNFENCSHLTDSRLIYSFLKFEKEYAEGGYVNKGLRMMMFTKDYYLKEAPLNE
jgi:LysM repeat protein